MSTFMLPSPTYDMQRKDYFWRNPRTWEFPYKSLIYGTLQEWEDFIRKYVNEEIEKVKDVYYYLM